MKQPSFKATPTKVDVEALPHCLTIIFSPELSLKLKGNLYSNPFSTSPTMAPKCWANYWANLSTLNSQPGLVSLEVQVQETIGSKYSNEWNTNMLLKNQQRLALYGSSCLWKVQLQIQQSKPKIIFICNQKFVKERTQRSLVSYTISYLRSMVCK